MTTSHLRQHECFHPPGQAGCEPDLESVGERVERAAERDADAERFVTGIIAEIGPGQWVTVVNYGHPPPLILRGDGRAEFAVPHTNALPLGLSVAPQIVRRL
jgi:serine phosphatase RsbU (regulator of sigma subunit)